MLHSSGHNWELHQGGCLDVLRGLPDASVHCCVTSPPYWGLRDYGTDPQVWGGAPDCDHEWQDASYVRRTSDGGTGERQQLVNIGSLDRDKPVRNAFCTVCGAWRGELGLEPKPDLYVEHLVLVFREVRRLLRPDGTFWLNLGDSYAGSWGNYSPHTPVPSEGWSGTRFKRAAYDDRTWRPANSLPQKGLKAKDLVGIPWRVALALQADGWYLRSDIVWCLSGGAWIYAKTQKGEMPMMVRELARLRPGTVRLWNGENWTPMLSCTKTIPTNGFIEILLRSGERISCSPGHYWPTQRGNVRADELSVGDVIATCGLPEPEVPSTPKALPDEIGWFVGLYLAEGSRSGDVIQIAGHAKETERHERLRQLVQDYGGTFAVYQTSENGVSAHIRSRVLRAVLDTYLGGRVAEDKHLAVACWRRSNTFLRAVLDGYLSGDGHWDRKNGRWRIAFTRNYALEQSLRTLCARLNISLRLKLSTVHYNGALRPTFRGEIRFVASEHFNAKPSGEVVRISRGRARTFWDISVADEPHVFALASGVLTHNSKQNCMPESVRDRPTRAHEYVFLLAKSERYFYDADAVSEPMKASSMTRVQTGWNGNSQRGYKGGGPQNHLVRYMGGEYARSQTHRNRRTVWSIATKPYKGAHFAVFPPKLVEPCILAGTSADGCCTRCGAPRRRIVAVKRGKPDNRGRTHSLPEHRRGKAPAPERGWETARATLGWEPACSCSDAGAVPCVVLDPFAGSGTAGAVAIEHGRRFIGIELNPAYCELAAARLRDAESKTTQRELPACATGSE